MAKEDCEVSEGRSLLADPVVNLAGACITLDSLHNKTRTMQAITRKTAVAAITPVSAGLAGARSAISVERTWSYKATPDDPPGQHTRYFLSSLDPERYPKSPCVIRGHWMVENANHYKRDTCQWREDDHRHRRINVALNVALTRNALPE
ncbi:MAG: hypothetical protein KJO21_10615 [Verrucomicrobiae bacterium]|nr:hypothetical protein [Verrucomicrobiae bacterium]NNJ42736.1 hypothetical protein [Akkermansiaceae bacterium]